MEGQPVPLDTRKLQARRQADQRQPAQTPSRQERKVMGPQEVERIAAEAEKELDLRTRIIDTIKTCYDPEIPVNIYELGLVYRLEVSETGRVDIDMTLTTPACPVAGSLVEEVRRRVAEVPGVTEVNVQLVWDPPWSPDRMSESARLQLGFM